MIPRRKKTARTRFVTTSRRRISRPLLFPSCRAVTCVVRSVSCQIHEARSAAAPSLTLSRSVEDSSYKGVKEVTLLGQIVNLYGRTEFDKVDGKSPFVQLLEAVHDIDGLERIRFTSPHPIGYRKDLVDAFTYLPKLCSHIHFPMQSGSDRILKQMRRPYKHAKFVEICQNMKAARPDLAITTDIIVGFPGETEEDFQATVDTVKQLEFDNAFVFRYSKRRNTPAAEMEGQISERVKEERNQILLAVVNELAVKKNEALVGTRQQVLCTGLSKTNKARLMGRTAQNKIVIFDGDAERMTGQIFDVLIEETTGFSLYGTPVLS